MFQLAGTEIETSTLNSEIDGLISRYGDPSRVDSSAVANFLELYPASQRDLVGRALVGKGISNVAVANALRWNDTTSAFARNKSTILGVLSLASAAACGFHGYRRNNSYGWAAAWFILGGIFPVFTPVVALAQGFGKPK